MFNKFNGILNKVKVGGAAIVAITVLNQFPDFTSTFLASGWEDGVKWLVASGGMTWMYFQRESSATKSKLK